jgi:ketosteroid isomerase-like protein
MDTEIRQLEDRLRVAMLASDISELDVLIHDRLLFVGSDCVVYRKEDDLELHRSGQEKLTQVDLKDVQIESHGSTAIAVVVADMAGIFKGQEFEGRYRYIRTWTRSSEGWRVIAGSVCAVAA